MHQTELRRPIRSGGSLEATMLRTLNAFAVDLIQIPNVEDLFWYVARNVVGRLNFVDCVVYQADEDGQTLRQAAAWGEKNPFARSIVNPLVIPFGRGITGKVAQTRAPAIVDDLVNDQDYIADTQPARSEICVPLLLRGKVVGVIDCEDPESHAFGAAELEILSTVAAMTGAKLELLAEIEQSTQRYRDLVASHERLTRETDARKALEAELFEARRMETVGKLTGRFAHEFNNLLTVIQGNLEFLEADPVCPDNPELIADAKAAAVTSARLVKDMLAFAQRTRLVPVEVGLNDMIAGPGSKGNAGLLEGVILDLSPDLWKIRADRNAIEEILRNVIENARYATADGGMTEITTTNLLYNLNDTIKLPAGMSPGRYVRLSVLDTGSGIPEHQLGQVFDPFFTTKPLGTGTGLGLSIVRGHTMQSGGAVTIHSAQGQGTRLDLYFPAVP